MIAAFRHHPHADVICGDGYITDRDGALTKRFLSDPFDSRRYALGGVTIMQQSTFFRSTAFIAINGFNIDNKSSWDGELMLDMGLAGLRFAVVRQYWSIFRIHSESISGSQHMAAESRRNRDRYF